MNFEDFVALVEKSGGEVNGRPATWKSVSVVLKGKGTSFSFSPSSKVDGLSITDYGGNNRFKVGERSKLTGTIKVGKGCELSIGENFTSTGGLKFHLSEGCNIHIGNDCMLGLNVNIYNHDYHPVFSASTGKRLNWSKDVIIKDHVWLANNVTVLKGSIINSGSVVGIESTVVGEIPSNCIAVGNPAKVIKEGIVWDRASLNTSHPDGIESLEEI
ncbi:acyltransferase [Pseudomonas citronellolis]|uniref:acyltransferase n=1 Tax=Pseudomonas citronellolis TaxID=53408 RepID=UPI000A623160|nr:acyltransferase [Pseudomonas citronellolis]